MATIALVTLIAAPAGVPMVLATPVAPDGIASFACGAVRADLDALAGSPGHAHGHVPGHVPSHVPGHGGPEPGALALDTPAPGRDGYGGSAHPLGHALHGQRFSGGDGVRVQCVGAPAGRSYPVTWQFRLEQLERVETLNGERSLTAFEERYAVHDPGEGRRVADVLVAEVMTPPEARHWRVGADGTTLHARQSARRDGAPCAGAVTGGCSVAIEVDWRLGGTEQRPELSLVRYVNGAASGAVLWRLQR